LGRRPHVTAGWTGGPATRGHADLPAGWAEFCSVAVTEASINARVMAKRRIAYARRISASFFTLITDARGQIGRFADADRDYFYPALARRYALIRE
jgi:hypothetical protein